jgi:hypothetical protein
MTLAVPGDAGLAEPVVGEAPRVSTRVPGLTVAAVASIGAGIIHATASGVHAEHPQLARLFVLCAVAQVGAGLLAIARPNRLTGALIVVIDGGAVVAWLATRITGISWVQGLEVREAPQFADTACALLGASAVGCALAAAMIGARRAAAPRLSLPALAVAALTVPAMLTGSTHVHSHTHTTGEVATAAGAVTDESQSHTHTAAAAPVAPANAPTNAAGSTVTSTATNGVVNTVPATNSPATTAASAIVNWPRPWDPSQPIDVSGVPGVTPDEQARATKLIEDSLKYLPKYADPAAAIADGYASIGDAVTGDEHYIKTSLVEDDVMLDATQPESLVYKVDGDKRILAGAMYIASARPTDDPSLLAFAGPLMQWHNHGNLCWSIGPDGNPRVVGITDASGHCAVGVNTGGQNPMVHVWITPHPCGVFAALEGVGAGQATVPDDQRVDLCNQPHTHAVAAP